jgi:hypothetical protein
MLPLLLHSYCGTAAQQPILAQTPDLPDPVRSGPATRPARSPSRPGAAAMACQARRPDAGRPLRLGVRAQGTSELAPYLRPRRIPCPTAFVALAAARVQCLRRRPCARADRRRRPDSPARGPPGASRRHHEHPRIEPRLFHRFPSPEELQSAAAP